MESPAVPTTSASGLKFMLRALRYRNYRLFFLGQGVSLIGTWLTTTATSWLVLRLARTGQVIEAATVLGAVRFASQIPMSLITPAAGVLIDRWNRHHVLMATQALSLLQSIALAALTMNEAINVLHLILLSIFQGIVNSFDAPARLAFVVELVENREDLPNAIALNSSMFNGARLLGPAIAGILIARIGEALCFVIDAVSYFAVLIALMLMRLKPPATTNRHNQAWQDLCEGFRYVVGFAPIRALLLLAGFISFTVGAYQTLMPIFAEKIASPEHAAAVFGFMGAAVGVGALGGAIYLASRRTVVGLGRIIAWASMLAGASMAVFAATSLLWLMLLTSIMAGFGMIVTFASSNTLLQTIVEDNMRGRLMSFFIVAVMGAAPVGSLVAGWVADQVGEANTIITSGILSIAAALMFLMKLPALRPLVREIYIRKGIVPQVAEALRAADRLNTADER